MSLLVCSEFGKIYRISDNMEISVLFDGGQGNIYTCVYKHENVIIVGTANEEIITIEQKKETFYLKRVKLPFGIARIDYITSIGNIIFLCSQSNDLMLLMTFDDLTKIISSDVEYTPSCCVVLLSPFGFSLNGIQSDGTSFFVSTKRYERFFSVTSYESGLFILDSELNVIKKEKYGWNTSGFLVDSNNELFCVCNNVYGERGMKTCLVHNTQPILVFGDDYTLSSITFDQDHLYISGKSIEEVGHTTVNSGIIVKVTRENYKIKNIICIENSGLLTGCYYEESIKNKSHNTSYLEELCRNRAIVSVSTDKTEVANVTVPSSQNDCE